MAVTGLSFAKQVNDWCRKSDARMETVFKTSVNMLMEEVTRPVAAGGHMPVDTGNLRRSFAVSSTSMPVMAQGEASFTNSEAANAATVVSLKLGQTAYLGFQAAYARRVNYGFVGPDSLGRVYGQWGYNFVDLAAQKWPQIVTRAATQVQSSVEARR